MTSLLRETSRSSATAISRTNGFFEQAEVESSSKHIGGDIGSLLSLVTNVSPSLVHHRLTEWSYIMVTAGAKEKEIFQNGYRQRLRHAVGTAIKNDPVQIKCTLENKSVVTVCVPKDTVAKKFARWPDIRYIRERLNTNPVNNLELHLTCGHILPSHLKVPCESIILVAPRCSALEEMMKQVHKYQPEIRYLEAGLAAKENYKPDRRAGLEKWTTGTVVTGFADSYGSYSELILKYLNWFLTTTRQTRLTPKAKEEEKKRHEEERRRYEEEQRRRDEEADRRAARRELEDAEEAKAKLKREELSKTPKNRQRHHSRSPSSRKRSRKDHYSPSESDRENSEAESDDGDSKSASKEDNGSPKSVASVPSKPKTSLPVKNPPGGDATIEASSPAQSGASAPIASVTPVVNNNPPERKIIRTPFGTNAQPVSEETVKKNLGQLSGSAEARDKVEQWVQKEHSNEGSPK